MIERKTGLDGTAIGLLVACCLFWGFQQVLVKATLAEVPPVYQASIRFAAASALICGRSIANITDLWILRHIWDIQEQQEVLGAIVDSAMEAATEPQRLLSHPQSQKNAPPNAEEISQSLDRLLAILADEKDEEESATERLFARDQLSALATRSQWIADATQRTFLQEKCDSVWTLLQNIEGT